MTRTWRLLALALGAMVVVATFGAVPGAAAARRDHRSGPTTLTVMLRAPHPGALKRLAAAHGLTRKQRADRLRHLLPSEATRRSVTQRLRRQGLRITEQGSWSITAAGTATQVRTVRERPGSLGSSADIVPDVGPLHPMATNGQDYRDAYAPTGAPRDLGTDPRVGTTTVATLQFATFDPTNLTRYAAATGHTDPVGSGQYQSVLVGTGPANAVGTEEVALDQESILATAPNARQRAYFAVNNFGGVIQALQRVIADDRTNHISALSISWGYCESDVANFVHYTEPLLQSLSAAGVTVFAASGDSGVYCTNINDDTVVDVSYPASSPHVIAVGGTELRGSGSGWDESAWSCTDLDSCLDGGGSGGGPSSVFARPSWQLDALGGTSSSARLVPDVSAVGDPATGFSTYLAGSWRQYGGTSLASPVAASVFAAALAMSDRSTPPDEVHAALYRAYTASSGKSFRDVVTGCNGDPNHAKTYSCAVGGYDTVSGLGSALWGALYARTNYTPPATPTTYQIPPPSPTTRGSLTVTRLRHGKGRVVVQWATVERSSIPWARTTVYVKDLKTQRFILNSRAYSGTRVLWVPRGHVLRLVAIASDIRGQGNGVILKKRVG